MYNALTIKKFNMLYNLDIFKKYFFISIFATYIKNVLIDANKFFIKSKRYKILIYYCTEPFNNLINVI